MFALRPARCLVIAAALLLLAPPALARSPAADPTTAQLHLALADDGGALLTVLQTWTGSSARALRQSLDVYFGAADGILTADELRMIAEATEEDMRGKTLPWISSGGAAWSVVDVDVEFEGGEGRVSSTSDVVMRHVIQLTSGAATLPPRVDLEPPWSADLTVTTPPTYVVEGGAPAKVPGGTVTTLGLVPAPTPEPERPTSGTGTVVLGIAVAALAIGALAVAGFYLWEKRRSATAKRS